MMSVLLLDISASGKDEASLEPSHFENIKTKDNSLPEQAAEQISQLIIERQLASGDKLPNEFELAAQLHVGRGTIREAVKLLVSRNVLVIRRGLGTYIASRPGQIEDPLGFAYYPDQVKLGMDLLEVRAHLEPWVAGTAAQRASEENLREMREKCLLVEQDILGGRDHLAHDVEFHVCIAQGTQNLVVPNLIPIISYSVGLFISLTGNTLLSETIVGHRAIADAICGRDSAAAERMMRQHLEENRVALEQALREMPPEGRGERPGREGFV